ncbi:hypothetical protein ACHAQJ_008786 [Trichoderma viride]
MKRLLARPTNTAQMPSRDGRDRKSSDSPDLLWGLLGAIRYVFGWEADAVRPGAEPAEKGDVARKRAVETQNYSEENSLQGEQILIQDETQSLIRERISSADPENEEFLRTGRHPDEWSSQLLPDMDWNYEAAKDYRAKRESYGENFVFIGT